MSAASNESNEPELHRVELPEINRAPIADASMAGYVAATPGVDANAQAAPRQAASPAARRAPGSREPSAAPHRREAAKLPGPEKQDPSRDQPPAAAREPRLSTGPGVREGNRPDRAVDHLRFKGMSDVERAPQAGSEPFRAPGPLATREQRAEGQQEARRRRVGPIAVAGLAAVVVGGGCWVYFSGMLG